MTRITERMEVIDKFVREIEKRRQTDPVVLQRQRWR
jgi:hypothetical protein